MTTSPQTERFLALLDAHKGILYKVGNGYCRNKDDRGDLIQDIVIQLWRSFPRYDPAQRFSTWMYRIAINVAISAHRSEGRRVHDTVPIEDFGIELAAADDAMESASDDVRRLRRLIGDLGELDRALIILFLDGHTYDEIAEILGISPTNASTRVGRVKDKLQQAWAAAEKE